MSEPYWYPDREMLSDCCGALSATEIVNNTAICSGCREWAEFYSEEDEKNEGE